ncbi:unnamed protein product [Rhizopus stolonifer]
MMDNESIQLLKHMENGSCYARVIFLAKKLRNKLDKLKKIKSSSLLSPPPNCPLPPLPNALSIKHVQKKKGWKGFLTRTYRLGPLLVTHQPAPEKRPNLYIARHNGQERFILKLTITSDPCLGFTFSCHKISRKQKKKDKRLLYPISDDRVQSALYIWFQTPTYPPIQTASDLLRDGFKIYLVYP